MHLIIQRGHSNLTSVRNMQLPTIIRCQPRPQMAYASRVHVWCNAADQMTSIDAIKCIVEIKFYTPLLFVQLLRNSRIACTADSATQRTPTPSWYGARLCEAFSRTITQQRCEMRRRRTKPTAMGRSPPSFLRSAQRLAPQNRGRIAISAFLKLYEVYYLKIKNFVLIYKSKCNLIKIFNFCDNYF